MDYKSECRWTIKIKLSLLEKITHFSIPVHEFKFNLPINCELGA